MCPAKSVGLVRYPSTLAPLSGTQSIDAHCADNAHRSSPSLSVTCLRNGQWSNQVPVCVCDEAYRVANSNGKEICKRKILNSP